MTKTNSNITKNASRMGKVRGLIAGALCAGTMFAAGTASAASVTGEVEAISVVATGSTETVAWKVADLSDAGSSCQWVRVEANASADFVERVQSLLTAAMLSGKQIDARFTGIAAGSSSSWCQLKDLNLRLLP